MAESNEISDILNQFKLFINYRQFKTINYFVFPHEIGIIVNNNSELINLSINIGSIIINDNVNANIIIPEKYKEILIN